MSQTSAVKKVRFEDKVQVFTIPKHDECRHNEWIRRKIDFERRVLKLEDLLGPILKSHHLPKPENYDDDDDDFEIVFE